jgi:two-component system CheB/CheR fusion protein
MPLTLEPFDINDLIREVAELIQRTTSQHLIILETGPAKLVRADRDRIGQVLINLLSNAIKYSPDGRRVIVRTETGERQVTIRIQDFGIGMSEDTRQKVFERFFRARDNTFSTYPGLGLGLFIAADIVRKHGGEIWIESEKNKGTLVCFTIPVEDSLP